MSRQHPQRAPWVERLLARHHPDRPDLTSRVTAVNDVAKTARALLAALLVVAVTLAATMIAATDEALFRDAAKVFPSLSVEIRLSTAYALAPPVFLFLHMNALLQLRLLTRRLEALRGELAGLALSAEDRRAWAGQVHGLAFAQMRLTDGEAGWGRRLQVLITWISVVLVPVLLLLAAQMSFVRYQNWTITIIHIACLAADLALLFWFHWSPWPGRWRMGTAALAALLVEAISLTQALPPMFQDEPWNLIDRVAGIEGFAWTRRWLDLHGQVLVATDVKPELLKPLFDDENELRAAQAKMLTLSLPDRSFRKINLTNAELFAIDLQRADLSWAFAWNVQMRGANLGDAQMQGAYLPGAQMQGAKLGGARMQRAYLIQAQMQGANLEGAQMQGADLMGARMQGADLGAALMQGAYLPGARMQGANLEGAQMQRAYLSGAQMQGANLGWAQMQGADLRRADLSLATGIAASCDGVRATDAITGNTVQHLREMLQKESLPQNVLDSRLDRVKREPMATCRDGQPLAGRDAPPSDYAQASRDVACQFGEIALGLNPVSGDDAHDRAVILALAAPAGDACPGLRDLGRTNPYARARLDELAAELRAANAGQPKP
ncbi:membrane hypothetical protein [Magnetospirillum sp. LM-5]|uniref:pentapeptide repeat-containing protein n=1 Tax=Magnetospirillum sp. LM-5 TaxID=2681466 RepID=UPI0013806A15|nr:pentapeptide repeat-containing protein [Magnetospirillum sp. LM-5]CAA7617250.1 membrane hypothetical protein [Magnetospirillum sp. LM-5]